MSGSNNEFIKTEMPAEENKMTANEEKQNEEKQNETEDMDKNGKGNRAGNENGNAAEIKISILQSAPPKIWQAKDAVHIKSIIKAEIKTSDKLKLRVINISKRRIGEIKKIRKNHNESETVRVRKS